MPVTKVENKTLIVDCAMSPYEMFSPEFLNNHLRTLALMTEEITRIRYEEEVIIDFDEEKTKTIMDYIKIIREVESALINPETFGRKEDDYFVTRKELLSDILNDLYGNPISSMRRIDEYKEPEPTRGIFLEGHRRFLGTLQNTKEALGKDKFFGLVKELGNVREVFLSFAEMKTAAFVQTLVVKIPEAAKPIEKPGAKYSLPFDIEVQIYDIPGREENFYVQKNKILSELSPELKKLLKQTIAAHMEPIFDKTVDYATLYEDKKLEYRRYFLETAASKRIPITRRQALIMAKETVDWTIGLGAPVENLALDSEKITDIYIDSENAPLYIEHVDFGTCHTAWRYNRKLLEYALLNATLGAKAGKRLDAKHPLIDVMLKRLNMRCHLQGPPATFGELQGAFRIMKPTPFTYAQYLYYSSMSGFFSGYDDTMVGLGCSEGVMGVKGCGKTSLTAAKISAIGTKKRILPVQDIEEIPIRVYRKRGFHIGAAKVAPEEAERTALSLVDMTAALLRMGEAAVIINELRSATAIKGIIDLLNTQPGVFCLYNFHAESLKDVQDRLELVFGIPAASMFATDRYTFMHKFRFARKARVFRIINKTYETDPPEKKFVETFTFQRGKDIKSSVLQCNFLKNPEANAWDISDVDLGKMEKELDVAFVPPALKRRSDDTGIAPEQYMLQSFFKGRMYSRINKDSLELNNKLLREIDFILKCNATANLLLKEKETETGEIDYADFQKAWDEKYKGLLQETIRAPTTKAFEMPEEAGIPKGEIPTVTKPGET